MKYQEEYRDPVAAKKLQQAIASRDDAALDDHGSLRWTDTYDRQIRDR